MHRTATAAMVDPGASLLSAIGRWLVDATGSAPSPDRAPADRVRPTTSTSSPGPGTSAWPRPSIGGPASAARIAEETLPHVLTTMGLEDEFGYIWPPLVQAALAAGDVGLAERLMAPVTGAVPVW